MKKNILTVVGIVLGVVFLISVAIQPTDKPVLLNQDILFGTNPQAREYFNTLLELNPELSIDKFVFSKRHRMELDPKILDNSTFVLTKREYSPDHKMSFLEFDCLAVKCTSPLSLVVNSHEEFPSALVATKSCGNRSCDMREAFWIDDYSLVFFRSVDDPEIRNKEIRLEIFAYDFINNIETSYTHVLDGWPIWPTASAQYKERYDGGCNGARNAGLYSIFCSRLEGADTTTW